MIQVTLVLVCFKQITFKDNNSLGYSVRTTEIEYEIWGDRYPYSQKEIYDRIGLSTFICPKGADFFVRSNVNSDNFQAIQISISRWSISNWKSSSEIQTILKTHYVNLAILSSYFDVNDYESPIHHYLQDKNIFYFTTYVSQRIEYKIKQNQLFLSDSIWFGSQGYSSEINFYSIDKGETIISDTTLDNSYMQFFIFLDQQIDQNQRTVYSFLDMLGYLGGIFGVLFKLGMIIVGTISNKSFYASMLPTLFHEDSNQKCDSIHKTFKKNKSMDLFQRKSSINEEQKWSSSFQIEEFKCAKQNTTFEREETKSDIKKNNSNIPWQHHYNNEIDHQALTMQIKQIDIKTRTPFKYSIKELIFDIIWLHRWKFKGKTWLNRNKRHNAFTQAIKEFNSELDWVSIIKSIREMKAMIDIMMSENQQKLLKCYQSKQVKQEKISLATITPDNQNNFQFSRNTRSIRVSEQDKCGKNYDYNIIVTFFKFYNFKFLLVNIKIYIF